MDTFVQLYNFFTSYEDIPHGTYSVSVCVDTSQCQLCPIMTSIF